MSDTDVTVEALFATEDVDTLIASLTFEQGLTLLEKLVATVESGDLALERAVSSYEKGVSLIRRLRSLLEQAENRMKVLSEAAQ